MKFMVSESALASAYALIDEGNFREAKTLLEDALSRDLDNHDICFAASCCSFWLGAIETSEAKEPFEYGEYLINQWKCFKLRISKEKEPLEQTVYAFRKKAFSIMLQNYSRIYENADTAIHTEVCRKIGLCYKQLGDFEEALKYLTEANNTIQGRSDVLAEMADCYDLCGEEKLAKVIFREAFFVDPEKIDLCFLESPLITKLTALVSEKGYAGSELLEWIPVYATLYSVFNIKRTLKSQEVGRLKQDIYAKEIELKDPNNDSRIITPRLLNMYFWLIDYYDLAEESTTRIHEVLLKIKLLDKNIYMLYTGNS